MKQLKVINPKIAFTFVRITRPSDVKEAELEPESPLEGIRATLHRINGHRKTATNANDSDSCSRSHSDLTTSLTSSIRSLLPCAKHLQMRCTQCAPEQKQELTESPPSCLSDGGCNSDDVDNHNASMDVIFNNDAFSPNTTLTNSVTSNAGDDAHSDCVLGLFQQLLECEFITLVSPPRGIRINEATQLCESCQSELCDDIDSFRRTFPIFFKLQVRRLLIDTVSLLNIVHRRCLQAFITVAFDLSRDVQVTPVRLDFAQSKEQRLFDQLMAIADKNQTEVRTIIKQVVHEMQGDVIEAASQYDFIGLYYFVSFLF